MVSNVSTSILVVRTQLTSTSMLAGQHKSHPYSISSGPPVWLTNTESRSAGTAPGHIQTGSNDAWGQPSQAPGIASVSGTRAVQSTKLARRSPTGELRKGSVVSNL